MRREGVVAGAGGIGFGVLAVVAMVVASPPGGTYDERDVAGFTDPGHRTAIFVSLYLMLLAVAGLVLLLGHLRSVAGDVAGVPTERFFWGTGVAAAAAFAIGFAILVAVPGAMSLGGAEAIDARVTYIFVETGWTVVIGAGGLLLALSLVALGAGARRAAPWFRWVTLAAGAIGLASLAFFPFFVLLLWGIVGGIAVVLGSRRGGTGVAVG